MGLKCQINLTFFLKRLNPYKLKDE